MHKIEVLEKNILLKFPESPLEFSKSQLVFFSKQLLMYNNGLISLQDFKVNIIYEFLNLIKTSDIDKQGYLEMTENINIVCNLVNGFFHQTSDDGFQLKMEFYKQLLPSIEIADETLYGPSDALFNTVFGEYIQLVSFLNDYGKSQDETCLNSLIATVYRPKRANFDTIKNTPTYNGDKREPFNSKRTEQISKIVSKANPEIKQAIYFFIASSQHFIANNDKLDIGGGNTIDLTILFNSNKTNSKNDLGLVGTLYSLAETSVFGNVKEVAEHNTYDILAYLVNQTEQYNSLKSKTNAST